MTLFSAQIDRTNIFGGRPLSAAHRNPMSSNCERWPFIVGWVVSRNSWPTIRSATAVVSLPPSLLLLPLLTTGQVISTWRFQLPRRGGERKFQPRKFSDLDAPRGAITKLTGRIKATSSSVHFGKRGGRGRKIHSVSDNVRSRISVAIRPFAQTGTNAFAVSKRCFRTRQTSAFTMISSPSRTGPAIERNLEILKGIWIRVRDSCPLEEHVSSVHRNRVPSKLDTSRKWCISRMHGHFYGHFVSDRCLLNKGFNLFHRHTSQRSCKRHPLYREPEYPPPSPLCRVVPRSYCGFLSRNLLRISMR